MLGRTLDYLVGLFSPRRGAQRIVDRATLSQVQQLMGTGQGGYAAGKINRLTTPLLGAAQNENAVPPAEIGRMRAQSWQMFRDNPHARKIVRTIEAKVIGRGIHPESLAVRQDGTPHVAFRRRAKQLWNAVACQLDYRGRPGQGGQHFVDLQKTALRAVILGGEVLHRVKHLTERDRVDSRLHVPVQLQLIHAERLVNDTLGTVAERGNVVVRGIELSRTGRRIAYWLLDAHPSDPLANFQLAPRRIDARKINHLYVSDDVDQLRGTPWFAAALMQLRDTGDYQYNELKASALASCVSLLVQRPSGGQQFGLTTTEGNSLTDADGNKLTHLAPGMIVNVGNGDVKPFNPMRPGANAEAFIAHLLRGTAAGLPGVKSSTVTGDYRNSSFSSERSADNDAWPELEGVQDWFAVNFLQPIFEAVVEAGVLVGWFDGTITERQFQRDRALLLPAEWQGPVARSINPVDDAAAASARVRGGQSSPQMECRKVGTNHSDVLAQVAAYIREAQAAGVPDVYVYQVLGIGDELASQLTATELNPDDDPPADDDASDEPTIAEPQEAVADA